MKLQKQYIAPMIEFIDSLNLKGKSSLGRTKLKKALINVHEDIADDQYEAITEYDAWIDKEEGRYKSDIPELNEVIGKLLTQEAEIKFDSPFRKDLKKALEEYEGDLSGVNADLYAMLYEKLEE